MTDAERPSFAAELTRLSSVLNGPELTEPMLDGYWEALRPYSAALVLGIIRESGLVSEFLPKPAQLLKFISNRREEIRRELRAICEALPLERQAYWKAKYAPDSEAEHRDGEQRWRKVCDRKRALEETLSAMRERRPLLLAGRK